MSMSFLSLINTLLLVGIFFLLLGGVTSGFFNKVYLAENTCGDNVTLTKMTQFQWEKTYKQPEIKILDEEVLEYGFT